MMEAGGRADTRATIVDVAARLLQEQGPSAVTTRGVAEAAGVQAPAIYRLFGDKDGLLEAVAEQVMSTFVVAKAETVESAAADRVDPLEDLHTGWDTYIAFGLANPSVFRFLSDPERARDSAAARSGKRVLALRVHRVAANGRLRVSEQRATDLIHAAGVGVIQTLLSTPPEHRDPGLAEAMYQTVLQHILTDAPVRPGNGTMTAAIAFRAVVSQLDTLSEAERHLMTEWLDRAIDAAHA
jgi:AcrR family transcriptional regulator